MAYKITDSCVASGTCAGECHVRANKEGPIYLINHDECLSRGACAGACPVGAIQEG